MSPNAFFTTLLLAWTVLYVALPAWLLFRGWLLSSGLVQLFGAFLPGTWQGVFWPNEAGNLGLVMMMLAPIPLCIILAGLVAGLVRTGKWVSQNIRNPGL